MFKRIMSLLMALVLLVGMVPPVDARAEAVEETVEETVNETVESTTASVETTEAVETTVQTEPVVETTAQMEPIKAEKPLVATTPRGIINGGILDSEWLDSGGISYQLYTIWTLDSNGVFEISFTTEYPQYSSWTSWSNYKDQIRKVIIPYGYAQDTYAYNQDFRNCTNLTEVDIGMVDIPDRWFEYCENLEKVTLRDTVVSIGERIFWECKKVEELTIPESVYIIGEYAFCGMESLKEIKLPETVISLGKGVFQSCKNLTSATLPSNITAIPDELFYGCKKLAAIVLPQGIKKIGEFAFSGCESLTQANLPEGLETIDSAAFQSCKELRNVVLPETLKTIGGFAFNGCDAAWVIVEIPAGVTSIGEWAFQKGGYHKLRQAYHVSEDNEYYSSDAQGVLFDKEQTVLMDTPILLSGVYTMPDTVRTIMPNAFIRCEDLTEVRMPDGVSSIGYQAFYFCKSLVKANIPASLKVIEDYTFNSCPLTEIILPEGLTKIGKSAFNCNSLQDTMEDLIIPDSVQEIGANAFGGSTPLNVYFMGDAPTVNLVDSWDSPPFDAYATVVRDGVYYRERANLYYSAKNKTFTDEAKALLAKEGTNWIPIGDEPMIDIVLPDEQVRTDPLVCGTMRTEYGNGKTLLFQLELIPEAYYSGVSLKITLPEGFSFDPHVLDQEIQLDWEILSEKTTVLLPYIYPIYIDAENQTEEYSMELEISGKNASGKFHTKTMEKVFYRPVNTVNTAIPYCPNFEDAEDYVFTLDSATGSGSTYNQETARLCAMMSDMAYDEEMMELFLTSGLGFSDYVRYDSPLLKEHEIVQYFATKKIIENGEIKNLVYVVCRGTVNLREWMSNFSVFMNETQKYHNGFLRAAGSVSTNLIDYCYENGFDPENTIIVATGHSRGAAVANLIGSWLNRDEPLAYKENICVYTFETPTVNKDIVSEAAGYTGNENIFNFVNYQDAIRNAPSMQYYGRYGSTRIFAFDVADAGETIHSDGYGSYILPNDGGTVTVPEILNGIFYNCDVSDTDSFATAKFLLGHLSRIVAADYNSSVADVVSELYNAHCKGYYDAIVNGEQGADIAAVNARTEDALSYLVDKVLELEQTMQILKLVIHQFACPINLYVYDAEGNLVASIVDKEVFCTDDNLLVYVDGESLNVGYLEDVKDNYTICVVGYDEGTMNHCIQTVDIDGMEHIQVREDIPIVTGGALEVNADGYVPVDGEKNPESAYVKYENQNQIEEILQSLLHTHEFGNWTQTKAPSCVEDGSEERICTTCGDVETRVLAALGHSYITRNDETCCQVCGQERYVDIPQDYVVIEKTIRLTADVQPAELASSVTWTVEEGGEAVISVDENGNVTVLSEGTAYVIASVSDGELTLTDRCRIDVAAPIELDGVKLSTDKLTTELYSTDYAEADILLLLPQNYALASNETNKTALVDKSAAISDVRFTDAAMAELFDLVALDDRTVAVVPTDAALANGKAVQSKYIGSVTVTVQGKDYVTSNLTLTVKKTLPKLKAAIDAFNNFYSFQSKEINVTGATVTGISCENLPDWLRLQEGELSLTENVPAKGGSAKLTLLVETEEWAVPAEVALNVKCSYKEPGLKLSASSVQFTSDTANSDGVQLQLLTKDKKQTLTDLNVSGISAPAGYSVSNFNAEDGTFILKAESGFLPGKISLNVSFGNTDKTMPLSLSVKTVAVALKVNQNSITLNSRTGDSAVIGITATPADYRVTAPNLRLEGSDKSDKLDSGELSLRYEGGKLYISTTETTPDNAKYTLYISAGGSKEVAVKISTVNAEPTLKLKAAGNLDLSFPGQKVTLSTTFKNHSGGNIRAIDYHVTEGKGKEILNEDVKTFSLTKEGTNLNLSLSNASAVNVKNTYTLYLTLTLADGSICESSIKIPVKQTAVNLKLSNSKITLNNTITDKASVTVTCNTKDYAFTQPVWQLMDAKGKESAEGKLDIVWIDEKLVVSVNESTEFGTSYKLLVSAEEGAKETALTVTIPAANKSGITGTLKLTGSLDVIRDGTAITVTPTFKNCAEAERTGTLTVLRDNGEDVTKLFHITQENGGYLLSRTDGATLDHSGKYTVILTADFGNNITTTATAALKLKMGSAKLTLNADSTTLFAKDKHSRINISFASTDSTLNKVAKVEIKDAKLREQFELFDYGNGQYAIGFKAGMVPEKVASVNLPLEVWLEGNETSKANASLKVKVSIVR